MTKRIKDILRCYAMGMGIRSISSAFCVSRNTVRKYVRMFQDSGLGFEQLQQMQEHHLQELFCTKTERDRNPSDRQTQLEALLPDYAARLKRKGVTLNLSMKSIGVITRMGINTLNSAANSDST